MVPSYDGGGLVNLVAEIEQRLTGQSISPGLTPDLASALPQAETYVLAFFDGLGHHALGLPAASSLRASSAGKLHASFPTTTSVGLATVATGLAATGHGIVGHLMWMPAVGAVVNTLKWVTPAGTHVEYPTETMLPAPNLWERLARAGVEPVTVQPADFAGSPLSRCLYRGCRFEPAWSPQEAVEATLALARRPRRLILVYLPHVDYAAHVHGSHSPEHAAALSLVDDCWSRLASRLPPAAALIGTADHGLIDYPEETKTLIRDPAFDTLTFSGDPRSLLVSGQHSLIERLGEAVGCRPLPIEEAADLWGPGPEHPDLRARLPDALLLAPAGRLLLPKGFDRRLTGYHGGLEPEEVEVPFLVA
jgi:hypothetical protein